MNDHALHSMAGICGSRHWAAGPQDFICQLRNVLQVDFGAARRLVMEDAYPTANGFWQGTH